MTDNEIIKALECCQTDDCESCPLSNYDGCKSLLFDGNIVLDLINRQKENYELKTERLAHYMKMLNFSIEERNKLRAETERLQNERDDEKQMNVRLRENAESLKKDMDYFVGQTRIAREQAKTAKSEAIKEFAERLKKLDVNTRTLYSSIVYEFGEDDIDNLVKEMVGE